MRIILFLALAFTAMVCHAQDSQIQKEKWHWGNSLKQDTSAGYAQVVKIDNVLYISGAVARDVTPEGIASVHSSLEKSLKSFWSYFSKCC